MQTGENEQGLRKILDMTRMISIVILLLHFYFYCYKTFSEWDFRSDMTDKILQNLVKTGLFTTFHKSKLISLVFLMISLIGAKGKKDENITHKRPLLLMALGASFYFLSLFLFYIPVNDTIITAAYILTSLVGFTLLLSSGISLSKIITQHLNKSVFNNLNETFPQEERLLHNAYSINLPARYNLKGKIRKSWINIINPFRGLLILGSPGSGKSYFIVQHIIKQHIEKGFSMFVYDFKFNDLSKITYNQFLKNKYKYKIHPEFFVINFDDLSRSHRCNPLDTSTMHDITDAAESSRTIMLGLNRDWIKKTGDFFVESPINFVTALIWYLCKYKNGRYCTLPHVIELAQIDYDKLFSILRAEPEIEVMINPFVTAYLNDAKEQLEGQIASAKISLSRLSSPQLYYILAGNDFTLDINNPERPKIICMGNNPQKTQTYGAVLSLYINAMTRMINKKNCMKSSLIFDEFPTIYFNGIDNLIATARSNQVATTLALQDASQLKLQYSKEQAEVIMNIVGNIISGQVSGETAKHLSEKFGKILQDRQSIAINRQDTSITNSKQLDFAVPVSRIASLSSGEFVGLVTDNPDQKIALKTFCAEIINDHSKLAREDSNYVELPLLQQVDQKMITSNFLNVKRDVAMIIDTEISRLMDTPELNNLLIRK